MNLTSWLGWLVVVGAFAAALAAAGLLTPG